MAESSTLSFRVEDDIIDRLDDAAADGNTSRSALAREALLEGLQALADGEGDVEVPDHLGHDAKVRQMIAANKAERRQGKFRSEFSKQLKRSFENNETPGEFEQSVAGYIEEAQDMGEIPEDVRADMDGDAETYAEWVEEMVDYYRFAYRSQNFDHDPIDDPLGNHEGIENAREWVQRAEKMARADASTAQNIARFAIQDGVVPDYIEEEYLDGAKSQQQALISAAKDTVSNKNSAITTDSSDQPELE